MRRPAPIPPAAPAAPAAQDVLEDMDGKIDGVVDGGPCTVGVESTILDLTCDPPRLLRPGGLPLERSGAADRPHRGGQGCDGASAREMRSPRLPGMKYRHYAPKAPVTVVTGAPEESAQEILRRVSPGARRHLL